jgi:hypothetical protein
MKRRKRSFPEENPEPKRVYQKNLDINLEFPRELLYLIASFADVSTLLILRIVNKHLKGCAEEWLTKTLHGKVVKFLLDVYRKEIPNGPLSGEVYQSNLTASQEGLRLLLERSSNQIQLLRWKNLPDIELFDPIDFRSKPHRFLTEKLIRYAMIKNLDSIQQCVNHNHQYLCVRKLHITLKISRCSEWKDENHSAFLDIGISYFDGTNARSGDAEGMVEAWISTKDSALRKYFGKSAPEKIYLIYGLVTNEVIDPYIRVRATKKLFSLLAAHESLPLMIDPVQNVIQNLRNADVFQLFFDLFKPLDHLNISRDELMFVDEILRDASDEYHQPYCEKQKEHQSLPILRSMIDEEFEILKSTNPESEQALERLYQIALEYRGLHQLRANTEELLCYVAVSTPRRFGRSNKSQVDPYEIAKNIELTNPFFSSEVFSLISFVQATVITMGFGEYCFSREFKGEVELRLLDGRRLTLHYLLAEPSGYVIRYQRASVKISSLDPSITSLIDNSENLIYFDPKETGSSADYVNLQSSLESDTDADFKALNTLCQLLGITWDRKTILLHIFQFLETILLASARSYWYDPSCTY